MSDAPPPIGDRKADHLTLCAEGDVGFRGRTTLLEQVRARAIEAAVASVHDAGFRILAQADAAIPGPKGNREAFVYGRSGPT